MTPQKHILVIQDLSCIGRCALSTALPVLSCCGIQVTPLPTLLLSTHTGGFGEVYKRDLSEDLDAILAKWAALPLRFDAIHVGYLAGEHQLPLVQRVLDAYRGPDTLLFVDPVMGDWGKRYTGVSTALADGFLDLCRQADLIFPNRTEAALLLDQPYRKGADQPAALLKQLQGLLALGAKGAVITGVSAGDGHIGAACLTQGMAAPEMALSPQRQGSWPGTGDLFAATVESALLLGRPLPEACGIATQFLYQCLKDAPVDPKQSRFGAPFERALPWLMRALAL